MVERIRTLLDTRQLTPTQFADAIGVARPIVSHILSGRNKPSLEVVQRILAAMPDLSMPWLLNGTGPMLTGAVPESPASLSPVPEAPAQPVIPEKEVKEGKPSVIPPVPAPTAAPEASVAERPSHAPAPEAAAAPSGPPRGGASTSRPVIKRFASASPKPTAVQLPVPPPPIAASGGVAPESGAPSTSPDNSTQPEAQAPEPAERPAPPATPAAPVSPVDSATAADSATASDSATATALLAGTEKPIRRIVIFYRDGSFTDYRPE
jgi:transcriptional regulator with XRE-family HTH domain